MAGHSKWKNIQHRKGAQDAKRGKIFTKYAKEITVAAKLGGSDPDGNPRLRAAMIKARANSMPKDNIERAIKKGTGDSDGADFLEKSYEGYGPGGVAILVECLTDNVNRTVADIRHAFSRFGGNLGTDGSVSWMFQNQGTLIYQKDKIENFDLFFEIATEHGADDIREEEDIYEVICAASAFNELKEGLDKLKIEPEMAEISKIPENYTDIDDEKVVSLLKMIDLLEDNDDVQNVSHNANLPE